MSTYNFHNIKSIKTFRRALGEASPDSIVINDIDIGGQDVKAMSIMLDGIVSRFHMNDKCAAVTGR